ncbi:hypothetical protein L2Y90_17865 [Burkholderia pyrrocinia]|uniref:hypothetical protein n=1 Tax=Burkholderia pyrrocinia TaxID=60550 RepID=UPI00215A1B3A|nr:hypothetical protein [Burkholderia pyrrocinia]UVE68643.1 hypothetical protein L2Y90_17865 [Burkholderia pyrrocinia]
MDSFWPNEPPNIGSRKKNMTLEIECANRIAVAARPENVRISAFDGACRPMCGYAYAVREVRNG